MDLTVTCPPGSYSGKSATKCTTCTAGFYCAGLNSSPTPCATGSFSKEGAAVCLICPIGHKCPDKDKDPVPCALGTYANGEGKTSCTLCSAGK